VAARPIVPIVPIVPEILAAASDAAGGRWVLVIGAGCSIEPPTNLRAGARYSRDAHRKLRADGVLEEDCPDPGDLSAVADAVFAKTGTQVPLVQRLPREHFRAATPNEGHLVAAALLLERSLRGVVTLNFDLAMSTALANLGAADAVATITGPDDIANLQAFNLVYLHRSVDAPAEEWVLRTTFLEAVWADRWEAVVATHILVAPVVVFAGLGSPAAALTETIRLIRQALPADGVRTYQVDIARFGSLPFTAALEIGEASYIERGWCDFMAAIAGRVLLEHWTRLEEACTELITQRNYAPHTLDSVAAVVRFLGLVDFGSVRARWFLLDGPYAPVHSINWSLLADLALAIVVVADYFVGGALRLRKDGALEVTVGGRLVAVLGLATGAGTHTISAVEAKVAVRRRYWRWLEPAPTKIIVSGYVPELAAVTAPRSIIAEPVADDIVSGTSLTFLSAYEVRITPSQLSGA
jgi:hypothetical protein